MPVLEPTPMMVDGDLLLRADKLGMKALERLRLKLSMPNPKYVNAIRMGFHPGAEPEKIYALSEMPDGTVHAPRGAIDVIKENLAKDGLGPRLKADLRTNGEPLAWNDATGARLVFMRDMRDYQKQAIDAIKQRLQGLVILPCGCGKTRLGVGAVLAVGVSSIILVHTKDLADQWLQELAGVGIVGGLIGDGRCEADAPVIVGIVDSLVPYLEANTEWAKRFGLAIVDEAHHTPAKTFQRALVLLPARWRLGLTATPDREDGLRKLMEWSFGPTLLERNTKEMIKLGYLMPAVIEFVSTGWRFAWEGAEKKRIIEMEKACASDLDRNFLIADRAAQDVRAGEIVLVLANRHVMVEELTAMIKAQGVPCLALTGKTGKKKRKDTIAELKAGEAPCVVATSLADEGLDVRRLSRIHLAWPQKARGATTQRLGRLLRLWEGKKPRLIDYLDLDVPTMKSRAAARRRVYRDAGLLMVDDGGLDR